MNQTTTEPAPAPVNRPKTTDKTKPLVLGGVIGALVLSLAACGYCVYDFTRGDAEITFDTTVGNNATTFEGGANINPHHRLLGTGRNFRRGWFGYDYF